MADKVLTWEEKLKKGKPLSELEQVKADATRITLRRIRDNQEDLAVQAEKAEAPKADPVVVKPVVEVAEVAPEAAVEAPAEAVAEVA